MNFNIFAPELRHSLLLLFNEYQVYKPQINKHIR
jgi:hypothetical protein